MSVVVDTHVLVWWLGDPVRLPPAFEQALARTSPESPVVVPDICLWEIATLVSLGRLRLTIPLWTWLSRATAPPLVRVNPIDAEVAAEVASLPDHFHRDPADRLIVATARVLDLPLLTQDERILRSGLVRSVGAS